MKNRLKIIVLVFCLLFLTPAVSVRTNKSHIEYFGYYYGMSGISYVSSYVNVMFVSNSWLTNDPEELANNDIHDLKILNLYNVKGIVNVYKVFFDYQSGELRLDWESRWNEYWRTIYPHLSKIAAFYPADEPDINLVSMADYARVTHLLREYINTVPYSIAILMVITSSGVIRINNGTLAVPPEVNWLGFDEYECWEDCYGGISIPDKFQILVNNAEQNSGRKVVVVPGAFALGEIVPPPAIQQQIVVLIDNYYSLCQSEPLCIAIFPFLWETMLYVPGGVIGTDSMEVVEARLREIGLEIKAPPPVLSQKMYLPVMIR